MRRNHTSASGVGTTRAPCTGPLATRTVRQTPAPDSSVPTSTAEGGLSTPKVFAELDRLREVGTPPRLDEPSPVLAALAAGDPEQLAPLLGNELQASALSLNSALRRVLRAGVEAGALAGIVSGSGPTCAFLCRSAASAVDVGTELSGAGVCRTVRVASGPVHGARVVPTPAADV